jgi:predicted outer membrane repeat protein
MKFAIGASVVALALVGAADAADLHVPAQYPTIQSAVNASVQGDRIILSAGLYRESVTVTKSLTIESAEGLSPTDVVLTATGIPGTAMRIGTGTYLGDVIVRGLTLDGQGIADAGQFAGLFVNSLGDSVHLRIERCVFKDLRNGGTDGGAVWLGHAPTTIRECKFLRNQSTVHGAAIYAYDNISPLVDKCVFIDHTSGTGTFYARVGANLRVQNSVVRNSNVLTAHFQSGIVTYQANTGCQIGALSNGGYVDGGGNNWNGPCPDCDSNGVIDLDDVLFGNADCDGNGEVDVCEISVDPGIDSNADGVIDACQCIPDITGNGTVDAIDLAAVLGAWGLSGKGEFDADITGDGIVNGADLATVLSGWGPCPN